MCDFLKYQKKHGSTNPDQCQNESLKSVRPKREPSLGAHCLNCDNGGNGEVAGGSVSESNLESMLLTRNNEHVHGRAQVMSDDATVCPWVLKGQVASHDVVCQSKDEYARKEKGKNIHTNTNTVEGFFYILKRGIVGTFHRVSKQHLDRYLSEFDFRYNSRDTEDSGRCLPLMASSVSG